MTIKVTVELPEELAGRARAAAAVAQRRFEDLLVEWIDRGAADPPVDSLSDDQVLALCDAQLDPRQQEELSELLAGNRRQVGADAIDLGHARYLATAAGDGKYSCAMMRR